MSSANEKKLRTTYEEIALQALLFIISIFSPHRPTKMHFCGAPTGLTCSQSRFSLTQIFYFPIKNIIHFYSFYLHPSSKKFALKKGDRCYTVSTKIIQIYCTFTYLNFFITSKLIFLSRGMASIILTLTFSPMR